MRMDLLKSSNISAAGYSERVLRIRFSNGTEYEYKNVPSEVYRELMAAKSPGKYYHVNIKSKYAGAKAQEGIKR